MEQLVSQNSDVTVVAQKSYSRNRVPNNGVVEPGQTNGKHSENIIPLEDSDAEVIVLTPENIVSNGSNKQSATDSVAASQVVELPVSSSSQANDTPCVPPPKDKQPLKGRIIRATYTKPGERDAMKCERCGKLTSCQLKTVGTKDGYFCDETCLRAASRQWKASSIQIIAKRTASPSNVDRINTAVNNVLVSLNTSRPSVGSLQMQTDASTSSGLPQLLAKTIKTTSLEDGPPPAKRPNIQRELPLTDKFDVANNQSGATAVFRCEQCSQSLDPYGENTLYWEAMVFCGDSCLGDHQQGSGSFCSVCNCAVTPASLGRYCVRFGYDIKQFCSLSCLQKSKTVHKLCTFCQRGLGPGESYIAHEDSNSVNVGGKRTVRFFCGATCVDAFKRVTGSNKGQESEVGPCAVCLAVRDAFKQFYFQDRVQQFCSEPCYNAFLFVNKVVVGRCAMCQKLYDTTSHSTVHMLESVRRTALSFCSRCCQNVYLTTNRVIIPCANCNVKKYNFDMICKGGGAPGSHFCSLPCLNLVKSAATTKIYIRRHPCHECHEATPLMYHIAQADGTKLSFCSKKCMDNHKKRQKTALPPSSESTPLSAAGSNTMIRNTVTSEPGVIPIITKVTSLAPLNTSNATPLSSALSKENEDEDESLDVESPSPEKHKTPTTLTPSSANPRRSLVISVPMQHFLMNVGSEPVLQHNKVIQCGPIMVSAHSQTEQESEARKEEKSESKEEIPGPTRQFCDSGTQTEPWTPLLPIPVPIYVPVPVPLFNFPYPVPLGVPVPLPLPLPVPARPPSVDDKEILSVQESTSMPNPDIVETPRSTYVLPSTAPVSSVSPTPSTVAMPSKLPSEKKLQQSSSVRSSTSSQDSVDSKGRRVSSSGSKVVEQSALPTEIPAEIEEAFRKDFFAEEWPPRSPQIALGRKAWELWVESENKKIPESLKLKAGPASRKPKLLECDLHQVSTESLSSALPRMIREMKKQNGGSFRADSLYYFCLGIQESLIQNGRKDCIFYDKEYSEFRKVFGEICKAIVQLRTTEQRLSEVREEHLWEAKLLGTATPQVLLFTLAYFNTKYFGLKSLEDHQKLSFRHLIKRWRRIPETDQRVPTSLTYTPASNSEGADSATKPKTFPSFKLVARDDKKEKCAIRIYEFYLAKCPQDADPQGKFYLSTDVECLASHSVWYTTEPQPEEELRVNLERILTVRDVQEMY